ncbi:MAG: hypothetical protein ACI4RI_00240 [Ruminococcus sp.]
MNFIYAGKKVGDDTLNRINLLLSTPKGTMPNDREYGIDISFLDNPINLSEGLFVIEASYALEKYEKTITVDSVEFSIDDTTGEVTATITLVDNIDYDEDEDEEEGIDIEEEVEEDE